MVQNCDKQLNHDSKCAATPGCPSIDPACTLPRLLYGMLNACALRGRSAMTTNSVSTIAAAAAVGLASAMAATAPVRADDYPARPITMVVPLAPGGSTDTL